MEEMIAKSYYRLIKAGRKTLDNVPENIIPYLKKLYPEIFNI